MEVFQDSLKEIIIRWENKRLYLNLGQVLLLGFIYLSTPNILPGPGQILKDAGLYLLVLNALYCLNCAAEIVNNRISRPWINLAHYIDELFVVELLLSFTMTAILGMGYGHFPGPCG